MSAPNSDINAVLAGLGADPVIVPAPATALRAYITDPEVVVETMGRAQSRVYRRNVAQVVETFQAAPAAPRAARKPAKPIRPGLRSAPTQTPLIAVLDVDTPIPGNWAAMRDLEALPLDGKTSLFFAGQTHGSLSTLIRKAAALHKRQYTVHATVREGIAGCRVWRVG